MYRAYIHAPICGCWVDAIDCGVALAKAGGTTGIKGIKGCVDVKLLGRCVLWTETARLNEGRWSNSYVEQRLLLSSQAVAWSQHRKDINENGKLAIVQSRLNVLCKHKQYMQCIEGGLPALRKVSGERASDITVQMSARTVRSLILIPVAKALSNIGRHREAEEMAVTSLATLGLDQKRDKHPLYELGVRNDEDIEVMAIELKLIVATAMSRRGAWSDAASHLSVAWRLLTKPTDTVTNPTTKDLMWTACRIATTIYEDQGQPEKAKEMDDFLRDHHHDVYTSHPDALRRAATYMINEGRYQEAEKLFQGLFTVFTQWPEIDRITDPDLDSLSRGMEVLADIYRHEGKQDLADIIMAKIHNRQVHVGRMWDAMLVEVRTDAREARQQERRKKKNKQRKAQKKANRRARKVQQHKDDAKEDALCNDEAKEQPSDVPVQELDEEIDVCSICLLEMEEVELHVTECRHCFHGSCMKLWIEHCRGKNEAPSCPVCRGVVEI